MLQDEMEIIWRKILCLENGREKAQRKVKAQMGRRHYNSNKHVCLQLLHTRSEPSRLEVSHQKGHDEYSVMSRAMTTTTWNDRYNEQRIPFFSELKEERSQVGSTASAF